jgi:hypothetical protein
MSSVIGPSDTDIEGNRETNVVAAVFPDFMWQGRREQEEVASSGGEGCCFSGEVEDDIPGAFRYLEIIDAGKEFIAIIVGMQCCLVTRLHLVEPECDPEFIAVVIKVVAAILQDPFEQRFDLGKLCARRVDVFVSTVKEMGLARFRVFPKSRVGMPDSVVHVLVFIKMQMMNILFFR